MTYFFLNFELDTLKFELRKNGALIQVEPQTFLILRYLLENRDRLVSKADLQSHIWQGRVVSDWAISAGIKSARVVLGDTAQPRRFIRTVHGKGIRFVAEVSSPIHPQQGAQPANNTLSLLVVPFENLSGSTDEGYFADGVSEDLILDLNKVPNLAVASRNASFSLRKKRLPAREIAANMNVSHILEGSIRRHNNALRINAQLIVGQSGKDIWSERFDGTGEDIFALQDQIVAKIVSSLKLHLSATKNKRGTLDPDAYDCCLRGRSEYYLYAPPHMAKAQTFFERAVEIDPNYAEAYAYQSYCRTSTYVFAWPGADETLDIAKNLARKAISLDATSAIAHARLGWVLGFLGQPETAIASFETAVKLAPENAEVFFSYGETMNRLGRPEQALKLLDKAFSIESFVPPSWSFGKGHSYALLKDSQRALDHLLPVLERVPSFVPARVQLARVYAEMGQAEEAAKTIAVLAKHAPKYRLSNAGRMFPYPDQENRNRLQSALVNAGL